MRRTEGLRDGGRGSNACEGLEAREKMAFESYSVLERRMQGIVLQMLLLR